MLHVACCKFIEVACCMLHLRRQRRSCARKAPLAKIRRAGRSCRRTSRRSCACAPVRGSAATVETTVCNRKGTAVDRWDWMYTNNGQDHSELRRTQAALRSTSDGVADHCMPRRIAADGQQTRHRRSGLSYSGHAQPPRLRCDTVSVAHGRRRGTARQRRAGSQGSAEQQRRTSA